MKRFIWGIALLCVACGPKHVPDVPSPTVQAVRVVQHDLPWTMEYPAQVSGSLDVQVRAQVGGILEARLYNEGEYVAAGTQLFQINDSTYKVALAKAQGALAQAQAEAKRTQRTYERMNVLRADNAVSQQDYDNALSAYEAAQANVQVAQAGVQDAQINLAYTQVVAPISGVVGEAAQSVGSLVSVAGDSGLLTTQVQIDPLYVNFSMPGRQFNELAQRFLAGQVALGEPHQRDLLNAQNYRAALPDRTPIYVEAVLADGTIYPQRGKIIFFDNTENAQTSSIAIKAEFANPKNSRALMPGEFVRVHLVGAVYQNAILIPSSAVLNTSNGQMVYVIDEQQTVRPRMIEAQLQDDLYIVSSGLRAGEAVAGGGLIKLREGMKVTPQWETFSGATARREPAPTSSDDAGAVAALENAFEQSEVPDTQAVPGAQRGK